MVKKRAKKASAAPAAQSPIELPSRYDWRSTDEQEIERRRQRARNETPGIRNLDPKFPVHSDFEVRSQSGMSYRVEILSVEDSIFSSTSPDFRVNGLGTDKHVEAVLQFLQATQPKALKQALEGESERIDVVPSAEGDTLVVRTGWERLPARQRDYFDESGRLYPDVGPEEALEGLDSVRDPGLRISQEVGFWLERRHREQDRRHLRREYEQKVHSGEYPAHETTEPLYPYQREGALHLVFRERALLADEMGLGKTIQAIAACAILRRLGRASRVLVVSPVSLKTEWEEQIRRFSQLELQIVAGPRPHRVAAYGNAPFFTLVNYEQMRTDALDVNEHLAPDVVVLDEAQRIKNWSSKTARSVKRLQSRYAFVLTGTPIENRIDELYSIIDFLDPAIFGPLFRFNRRFYALNERGRPEGYRNLVELRQRVSPVVLRRRKEDVESELPERTDHYHFVELTREQREQYNEHLQTVGRLAHLARRRPLNESQQKRLQKELAMMRMLCDTPYILDREDRTCPKLKEIASILDECLADADVKVILFSEWVRMLELVRDLLIKKKIGFAWHTGSVPQVKRRQEILAFKRDPACRLFLCSEAGSTGLNLQIASVVINCDLPWNPAKLEQRIARAWRKHQTRPVTVINLIARETIEHGMLATLSDKQELADGILDHEGDLDQISLRKGGQSFLKRLEQVLFQARTKRIRKTKEKALADLPDSFARRAREVVGKEFCHCEEQFLYDRPGSVVILVAENPDLVRGKLSRLQGEFLGSSQEADDDASTGLEVLSKETWEALQRLESAGLITSKVRARRILAAPEVPADGLTEDERAAIRENLGKVARKQKVAQVLFAGGLEQEAEAPLREAILLTAKVLAVRNRWPEPESLEELGGPLGDRFAGLNSHWIKLDGATPLETRNAILGWIRKSRDALEADLGPDHSQ